MSPQAQLSIHEEDEISVAADPTWVAGSDPALERGANRHRFNLLLLLAVVAAVGGVVASLLSGWNVRTFDLAASDFKTLYSSAWAFANGLDAYSPGSIAHVFRAEGIVQPPTWFGHSAVYPPFTLLLLTPLTLIPLPLAAWLGLLLSALFFGTVLYRLTAETFYGRSLSWSGRLGVIAFATAVPLLGFALFVVNVSVVVCSLCMLVMLSARRGAWWPILASGLALLLKPHIGIWLSLGLLLTRDRDDRRIALGGLGLAAIVAIGMLCCSAFDASLAAQFAAYRHVLDAELGSGSMNPASLNADLTPAAIVSLRSFFGYWLGDSRWTTAGTAAVLGTLAALLLSATARMRASLTRAVDSEKRLLLLNGWLAFGLVATYHRAHDGLVLYTLLPWIAWRLRRAPRSAGVWLLLSGFLLLSVGLPDQLSAFLLTQPWSYAIARFLVFRQSGAGALLLALTLAGLAWAAGRRAVAESAM